MIRSRLGMPLRVTKFLTSLTTPRSQSRKMWDGSVIFTYILSGKQMAVTVHDMCWEKKSKGHRNTMSAQSSRFYEILSRCISILPLRACMHSLPLWTSSSKRTGKVSSYCQIAQKSLFYWGQEGGRELDQGCLSRCHQRNTVRPHDSG